MDVAQLKEAARLLIRAHVVPFAWGIGGIGKTTVYGQLAEELGRVFISCHLAGREGGDLLGAMHVVDGKTVWAEPSWWPKEDAPSLLLVDEPNRCRDLDVVAMFMELLTERRLQTHVLPDSCDLVVAGNPAGKGFDVAAFKDPAQLGRFCHLHVVGDAENYLLYAKENDVHPSVVRHVTIGGLSALIERRQDLQLSPERCPRTWDMVSDIAHVREEESDELVEECIAGLVGPAEASGYMESLRDPSAPAGPQTLRLRLVQLHDQGLHSAALALVTPLLERAMAEPSQENVKEFADATMLLTRECAKSVISRAMDDDRLAQAISPHGQRLVEHLKQREG